MDEGMIEVAELREGDAFELPGVGTFGVVRIWGGGEMRTIHLEAWRQNEGAEIKLRSALNVRLVSRAPDELLKRVQDERRDASLASFDALVRDVDAAPAAPEVADEPAGEDVQTCEACAELEWPLYDVDGAMICGACAAGALEHERHTRHAEQADTLHHFTEQLRAYAAERDEARAQIAALKAERDDMNATCAAGAYEIAKSRQEERELRAELDRVRAQRDALLEPICAPPVPEPPPRAGGALVTPLVLAWIASQRANVGQERVDQALRLVMERDAFGRGKYGQGLSLEDGRDTVEDLRQELGDAIQYGYKARVEGVEGERLEEVRWLAHLLWLLLCADKVEVRP